MTHEEQVIQAIRTALPPVVSIVIGKSEAAFQRSIPEGMWREIERVSREQKHPTDREEIISHLKRTEDGNVWVGCGSGFFVSSEGLILTNKHVVADAEAEYTVITAAEDRLTAHVLARDPLNDVAILKVEGKDFPVASLGDSRSIRLGQSVVALGNALGEFQNTVSSGIVSGLSRFLTAIAEDGTHAQHLRGLIQTDAAINPGNSGGPLVNLEGEVIGINAAVVYGAENIGFAIPIDRARRDLDDIKKFGTIRRPFLGIRYLPINVEMQKKFGLAKTSGIFVQGEAHPRYPGVVRGSPAEAAGVREGDIIVAVNGEALTEKYTLEDILEKSEIGGTLALTIARPEHQEVECTVTLAERK